MMPSSQIPIYGSKFQHGGALLVMLVILVMGITTVFVTSLSGTAIQNRRNHSTAESLVLAKEALIGYALTYGDSNPTKPHGFLPCPDIGTLTEGTAPSECAASNVNVLGRLPWRTLDAPSLFDGTGECLWYAVSANYSNKSLSLPINWDTPAQLQLFGSDGVEIMPGEIVALVIAPNAPVNGNNNRVGSDTPICGGNYDPAAYLENDNVHGKNNASNPPSEFILPHEHRDGSGNITTSINDQIIYITRQDIWNGIQKRIARQAKKCLDDYASGDYVTNTNNKYPWAVPLSDAIATPPTHKGIQGIRFGRFPDEPNISTSGGSGTCDSGPLSGLNVDELAALNDAIQQVLDALNAYIDNPTYTTRETLEDKGDDLRDLAKDPPYNLPIGDPIRSAGWYVENNCDSSSTCDTTTVHNMLDAAFGEVTDCTGSSGSTDGTMSDNWSSIPSCKFISSTSWSAWRDLVFYQVADGFQPGATGTCVSCLDISNASGPITGSGNFHAVIAVAGKAHSSQNARIASPADITQFLDKDSSPGAPLGDNQTSTSFTTYRSSDAGYSIVNDLVLCVDGKNNCP